MTKLSLYHLLLLGFILNYKTCMVAGGFKWSSCEPDWTEGEKSIWVSINSSDIVGTTIGVMYALDNDLSRIITFSISEKSTTAFELDNNGNRYNVVTVGNYFVVNNNNKPDVCFKTSSCAGGYLTVRQSLEPIRHSYLEIEVIATSRSRNNAQQQSSKIIERRAIILLPYNIHTSSTTPSTATSKLTSGGTTTKHTSRHLTTTSATYRLNIENNNTILHVGIGLAVGFAIITTIVAIVIVICFKRHHVETSSSTQCIHGGTKKAVVKESNSMMEAFPQKVRFSTFDDPCDYYSEIPEPAPPSKEVNQYLDIRENIPDNTTNNNLNNPGDAYLTTHAFKDKLSNNVDVCENKAFHSSEEVPISNTPAIHIEIGNNLYLQTQEECVNERNAYLETMEPQSSEDNLHNNGHV